MIEPAVRKLGGMTVAARPVMQAQGQETRGLSHFTPSPTGQGMDVVSAIERDRLLGADVFYAAAFRASAHPNYLRYYRSSVTVGKAFSLFGPVSQECMYVSSFLYGTIGQRLELGSAVIEIAVPGDTSTTVTAVTPSELGSSWFVIDSPELLLSRFLSPSWLDLIEKNFELKNKEKVKSFLQKNQFLLSLVLEAEKKIKNIFGADARLRLEVVEDPESVDEEELFAVVRTTRSEADASERLHRLDEEWWLEASRQTRCKLNIDVQLV